jgi:ureidoacrylate peracid hydrolase
VADDRIDPAKTCLLFFDTSKLFVNGPNLNAAERSSAATEVVAKWRRQLDRARELQMMVAYALTGHRPDSKTFFARLADMEMNGVPHPGGPQRQRPSRSTIGTDTVAVIDEIAPRPEDYIFYKPRWDPFHHTAFEVSLRVRGVNTIIVNGGSTEIGISATLYAAQALDFDTIVVSDACTSRHSEVQDALMKVVYPRFGRVRTTDQIIAMMS